MYLTDYIHSPSIEIRQKNTHDGYFSVEFRFEKKVYSRVIFASRHLNIYAVGKRLRSHIVTLKHLFCCLHKGICQVILSGYTLH